MLVTKQFQFQLASIVFFVHTTEVGDNQNGLVTIIFQNILFFFLQKSLVWNDMRVNKLQQNLWALKVNLNKNICRFSCLG